MRLPFLEWPLAQILVVLLSMLSSEQSFAQQQAEKAQAAFEASGYLAQSDRELECNPERAKVWAIKALDTAAAARETDRAMIDTLGDLKSQSNIKIVEARKRIDLLNQAAREASGLIKQARLETAEGRLQENDPKGCYSTFESLRSEIDGNKSKADALVKRGDAVVDKKPKEAIKFYAGARQINAEYSELDQKMNYAKEPASSTRRSRPVAKEGSPPRAPSGTGALSPRLLHPVLARTKAPDIVRVRFTTTKGDFVVEVSRDSAPLGADRFYNLVRIGFFTNVSFYRVVRGAMVQFGLSPSPAVTKAWSAAPIYDDPVKQHNVAGSIQFAMGGPNTRTTQLFINLQDNLPYDGMGIAPIGKVTEGMDVVRSLYSGYGDMTEMGGHGPSQFQVTQQGKPYLDQAFPLLDSISLATVIFP